MTRLSLFDGPWDIWPWKVGCYYRNSTLSDRIHFILCLIRCRSYFRFCIWNILSFPCPCVHSFFFHCHILCMFHQSPIQAYRSCFSFFFFVISSSFCYLMSHVFILPFIHFVSCFIHCFLNVCCIVCLFVGFPSPHLPQIYGAYCSFIRDSCRHKS